MREKQFSSKIVADVCPDTLRKIYDRLEDEATPHEINVRRYGTGVKRVTIYCDTKDVTYFNTIVTDENKTEI